jgi:hypothetical protein
LYQIGLRKRHAISSQGPGNANTMDPLLYDGHIHLVRHRDRQSALLGLLLSFSPPGDAAPQAVPEPKMTREIQQAELRRWPRNISLVKT